MTEQAIVREADTTAKAPTKVWARHRELAGYVTAGVVYIALGFVAKEVFAWWSYGAIFVVVTVWGVPALCRRWRP